MTMWVPNFPLSWLLTLSFYFFISRQVFGSLWFPLLLLLLPYALLVVMNAISSLRSHLALCLLLPGAAGHRKNFLLVIIQVIYTYISYRISKVVERPLSNNAISFTDNLVRLAARRRERDHGQGGRGDGLLPGDAVRAPLRLGHLLLLAQPRRPSLRQRPRP